MNSGKDSDAQNLIERIASSRDRLYRVALAWCGDRMLADDLVQEAMKAGIINVRQLREEERLYAWLYSIMHNNWHKHLRTAKPQSELEDVYPCDDGGPMINCQEMELVERVRYAVALLPTDQRQVMSLVDLEECSYCEVSQILNIPIGTVMSRLHRARKNLLAKLDEPATEPAVSKDHIHIVK